MSVPDLPARMYRNGRPVDPNFDHDENLYRRCKGDQIDGDRLARDAIGFPDWSVNRARYSEPGDALLPDWPDWGVVRFTVGSVPPRITSPGGPVFEFRVEHVPEDRNYAHSEVRSYKNGQHSRKLDVPKTVKVEFRQRLSEQTTVIIEPQV
jgi:hypothetical protein